MDSNWEIIILSEGQKKSPSKWHETNFELSCTLRTKRTFCKNRTSICFWESDLLEWTVDSNFTVSRASPEPWKHWQSWRNSKLSFSNASRTWNFQFSLNIPLKTYPWKSPFRHSSRTISASNAFRLITMSGRSKLTVTSSAMHPFTISANASFWYLLVSHYVYYFIG